MIEMVFHKIREQGFYESPRSNVSTFSILCNLITRLEPTCITVHKLYPRDASNARRNSLSANYGTGRFPPHTDFAYLLLPPRYLALFCPVARPGATTLYNSAKIAASVAKTGTFRIRESGRQYSANFYNSGPHGKFYRYNADLMTPLDKDACKLAAVIDQAEPDHFVEWGEVSWVIIDNWSMLHGRQAISKTDGWLWRLALETHR